MMEGKQIREYISEVSNLGRRAQDETVLQSYIVSLIKILNGLNQINNTSSHKYEAKILVRSMKIFADYFIDVVHKILSDEDINDKIENLKDVENAICKAVDIYERIINNTNNTDKQMLMSAPINTTIYPIYPKICASCVDIINDIISLFLVEKSEKEKYGFLLNPTLRDTLYVETLFENKIGKGRFVIISLPVRILEKMDIMSLCLIHEVFHILTSKERQRKKRSKVLLGILIQQMGYRIFKNVCFVEDDEKSDEKIKNLLLDKWMEEINNNFQEKYNLKDEKDEFFYGQYIKVYFEKEMNKLIEKIETTLEADCMDALIENYIGKEKNIEYYSNYINQIDIIKGNLIEIKIIDFVPYLLDRLIFLLRELYSDLACLITSGYDLELYDETFEKNTMLTLSREELNKDDYHKIRQLLMGRIFEEEGDRNNIDISSNLSSIFREKGGQFDNKYVIVNKEILDIFYKYLRECYLALQETLIPKQKELEEFRSKLEKLRKDKSEVLLFS